MAFMVTIAIRFLPILRDEANDILTAIQLRGIVSGKSRFEATENLFVPVNAHDYQCFVESAEPSIAMELRAFVLAADKFTVLKMQRLDYLVMAHAFSFSYYYGAGAKN